MDFKGTEKLGMAITYMIATQPQLQFLLHLTSI